MTRFTMFQNNGKSKIFSKFKLFFINFYKIFIKIKIISRLIENTNRKKITDKF